MNKRKVLHIVNGEQELKKYLTDDSYKHATFISFNDFMCIGESSATIFKDDFISKRCRSLNMTKEEYMLKVITPLKPLFKEKFDLATEIYDLVLFDYDSSEAVALADYSDSTFYIINNFDEVTKAFTENEKKDLINNHGLLYTHDGQYYVMLGGIATYYSRADITDVYIEPEKIIATYSVDVSVAEEIIVKDKEITFTVVLENNKWLIDSYVSSTEIDNELNDVNQ